MKGNSIHIIGAGIMGLTSAWYLMDEGYEVTILDREDLQDGTSHGNAGMIVPSHFVPMAAPGVISQGLKWMFDSKSPFFVKPRMSLDLVQWLWKFYRSCNSDHVEECVNVLYDYNEWSKELYRDFAQDDRFDFCFEERGLLMLYRTKHQRDEELALAERANALGVNAEVLDSSDLTKLEPEIMLDALGGVYFTGDAHLYPNLFIQQLRQELSKRGAKILSGSEVKDFTLSGRNIKAIQLSNGDSLEIENVVVASGSWTPFLLKKLGVKILLQDGKGYSFTMQNQAVRPRIPTILTEVKVAVTPMGNDLRIGGTLELGGLSSKIHPNRLEGIVQSVPRYYPELDIERDSLEKIWMGYRPCSADGMPFLGKSEKIDNMIIATGHGMMGMSMGPATGKLVSQLAANKPTSINLDLMNPNR